MLYILSFLGQYPGLCGLFVSGIFSASLSTVSSAVSSLSAVTLEDYLKPLYKKIFKRSMTETSTTLPSKIMACFYGLVCIGLAFGAGSMGDVLQASLTVFGVVGGPLLAIFTLGMCTVRANQRGCIAALLCGLAFAFWIGFGGPKPKPPSLPLTDDGCISVNSTLVAESLRVIEEYVNDTITISTTTAPNTIVETQYFWLYRLSYMWYCVLGFIITFILGYIFSWLLECLNKADNTQIYVDLACKQIDYDLFVPILSRKLKQQTAASEELGKLNYCNSMT